MAETLIQFQTPVASVEGVLYEARACGSESGDGLWEGWIEFAPLSGGKPIRSARETTQPNRRDTQYWAAGLSAVYLQGALRRALAGPVSIEHGRVRRPAFDKPGPAITHSAVGSRESALDPFSVYTKGEQLLRRQLAALSDWHLVNIALAYDLTVESLESLNRRTCAYLIELIVTAVRQQQTAFER